MPVLPSLDDPDALAAYFAALAVQAGEAILRVAAGGVSPRLKADRSPVCEADEAAEAVILDALRRDLPGVPVVAEEATARGDVPTCGRSFILVDALDGTREFLNRSGDYTVNIAFVQAGVPQSGAVFAPALGHVWFGGRSAKTTRARAGAPLPEKDAWRPIAARPPAKGAWTAVASRSHSDAATEALLDAWAVDQRTMRGSSLKFCTIAEGQADVYPRFSPIMEWDIAAGDAILRAAGGAVLAPTEAPLTYGHHEVGFRAGGFIAWGDPATGRQTMAAPATQAILAQVA